MTTLNLRLATKEDHSLPTFDNTKLVAMNTCPTWGLIRYDQHKTVASDNRAMALEAGGACHQAFAAIRFVDLLLHGQRWFGSTYDPAFIHSKAGLEFPDGRWSAIWDDARKDSDPKQQVTLAALSALNSSGFFDDPDDKRRTIANLELALIAYVDEYKLDYRLPVYSPPHNLIGIETPFDLRMEIDGTPIRFIGRTDGVTYQSFDNRDRLRIAENKTASRLGNAWQNSFETSHQVTGYCVGVSTVLQEIGYLPRGVLIQDATIFGLAIPIPKYATEYNGVEQFPVTRRLQHVEEWADWVAHTLAIYERYRSTPLEAPKYTHSCNRYFRTCPLLPLCASPMEDRMEFFDQLVENKWSPLEEGNE